MKNCSVAVVGKGQEFTIYRDQMVEPFLGRIAEVPLAVVPPEEPVRLASLFEFIVSEHT